MNLLDVNIVKRTKDRKTYEKDVREMLHEEAREIEIKKIPLLMELQRKAQGIKHIKYCQELMNDVPTYPLRDLETGVYTVIFANKQEKSFGPQYKLLLKNDSHLGTSWSNTYITKQLEQAVHEKDVYIDGSFLFLREHPLGITKITGFGNNHYGHITAFCQLVIKNTKEEES